MSRGLLTGPRFGVDLEQEKFGANELKYLESMTCSSADRRGLAKILQRKNLPAKYYGQMTYWLKHGRVSKKSCGDVN